MAFKVYTLIELQKLGDKRANRLNLPTPFIYPEDAEDAYNYAARMCGFENPAPTDDDAALMQQWLLEHMQLYYLEEALSQYLNKGDIDVIKVGQVSKAIEKRIEAKIKAINAAKEDPLTAHLFVSASDVFGSDMVVTSGFLDDRFGEDLSHLGQKDSTTKPKQPTATEDVLD